MTATQHPRRLSRPYIVASTLTLLLTVVAAGVGLFVPEFYRDAEVLLPQLYGQDLLTLVVAVPILVGALYYADQGSLRGYVVWLGVTGYLLYTYASYALLTAFNELYLVYVALFGLTLFTLIGGVVRIDPTDLKEALDGHPVRGYVAFQALVAGLVALMWLAEVGPASLAGTRPPSIAETTLPVPVIQSLDLGVVVPSFALSAALLWKQRAWGYVFTGVLLVKGTTLGLAVLAMIVFMLQNGQTVPLPQILLFSLLSLIGLGLTTRFIRAIPRKFSKTQTHAGTELRTD
ncbi:hypothetical protein SAMN04487948_111100 [Halogranum amylolyticum]|uniref:Uncharacterized protein n=1 Tax=Halogranum amylolyticum TaxID=660520 RepID=A0A1H8UKL7_9EURY|nr:hypothetical protein [Halogranum amylolyticum]SEP03567.1 hypothetical protein SAMN04487948_111100 [Halogranum amylolyticum]